MENDTCIGCGFCCLQTPCEAAVRVYGPVTVCPALAWNGERHVCKLMELPSGIGLDFQRELYAGAGCCSNLNSWRREPLQNRIPAPIVAKTLDPVFQTFLHHLGCEFISGDVFFLVITGVIQTLIRQGTPEAEAKEVGKAIAHYLRNERTRRVDDFMGAMP